MELLTISCFYILQVLGDASETIEEHRTKRQLSVNFPRFQSPQSFNFTQPQAFVIGNTGQFQQVPSFCQGSGRHRPECQQFTQGNTGQVQQVSSFCQGSGRHRPECQQSTQGIGFPGQNHGPPPHCRGNRRNRPECRPQGGGGNQNLNQGPPPPHCRGHRKHRPECQQQIGFGGRPPKRPPNCSGRRRNRPECQGVNFPGQSCEGRRKRRPECQNQNQGGSGGQKDPAIDTAISQVPWLQNIISNNQYVKIPGLPQTPTKSQQSRFYQLAFGVRDDPYHSCLTPRFERGHCRFLQHCILDDFAHNFNVFLRYVCFIEGVYVGVCCPDSRYPGQTTTRRPPTTTTTRRPTQPPNSRSCGVSTKQQTRIVGGKPAQINVYPWAAALLRNENQYCGGVLINRRHVMTAAHCVDGFDQSSIIVRLGEYSFDQQDESQSKDFSLTSIKKHERYDTSTYVNDIALLTLDRQVDGTNIYPICLPPRGELFVGVKATVIGWGTIYFGGPVSSTLQEVTIPVWENSECDAAYQDNGVFPENLCAGDKAGGKDSCQGDSGGPLMYKQNNQWMVIGVVSWGIRCAEPGRPGVYARVSEFLSWIDQNTR